MHSSGRYLRDTGIVQRPKPRTKIINPSKKICLSTRFRERFAAANLNHKLTKHPSPVPAAVGTPVSTFTKRSSICEISNAFLLTSHVSFTSSCYAQKERPLIQFPVRGWDHVCLFSVARLVAHIPSCSLIGSLALDTRLVSSQTGPSTKPPLPRSSLVEVSPTVLAALIACRSSQRLWTHRESPGRGRSRAVHVPTDQSKDLSHPVDTSRFDPVCMQRRRLHCGYEQPEAVQRSR